MTTGASARNLALALPGPVGPFDTAAHPSYSGPAYEKSAVSPSSYLRSTGCSGANPPRDTVPRYLADAAGAVPTTAPTAESSFTVKLPPHRFADALRPDSPFGINTALRPDCAGPGAAAAGDAGRRDEVGPAGLHLAADRDRAGEVRLGAVRPARGPVPRARHPAAGGPHRAPGVPRPADAGGREGVRRLRPGGGRALSRAGSNTGRSGTSRTAATGRGRRSSTPPCSRRRGRRSTRPRRTRGSSG